MITHIFLKKKTCIIYTEEGYKMKGGEGGMQKERIDVRERGLYVQ